MMQNSGKHFQETIWEHFAITLRWRQYIQGAYKNSRANP